MSTLKKSSKDTKKEISVYGIYMGCKEQPKLMNSRYKVAGILSDPDYEKQVNFNIWVDELCDLPM